MPSVDKNSRKVVLITGTSSGIGLASAVAAAQSGWVTVEPGAVASEFVASQGIDIPVALAAAGPYAPALKAYIDRTLQAFTAAQTPAEAASEIIAALNAEDPAMRIQTSEAARAFAARKLADLDGSAVLGLTSSWVG